jgi:TonB family protein
VSHAKPIIHCLLGIFLAGTVTLLSFGNHATAAPPQASLEQLKTKLQQQYDDLWKQFAYGPSSLVFPVDQHQRLRRWQDDLARLFAEAGSTVDEILKLNPPDAEMWRERRDTLSLYSQPISPPESRTVFGSSEVQKRARLLPSPPAAYTDEARLAKAKGEVRLRVVLAGDGTVKNIFPMKPLKYGLTEAAMAAAAQLKFEPAIRNGQPVSQFATIAYKFKHGASGPPYFPVHEFYF